MAATGERTIFSILVSSIFIHTFLIFSMKFKSFSMNQTSLTESYFMGVNVEGWKCEIDGKTVHNFQFRQ